MKHPDTKIFYLFSCMEERYKILILTSFILLSFSFIYDLPAALNESINYGSNSNKASKLAMLYSVYALPNILIPLAFGWASSINLSIISEILCCLVLLGQVIYSMGVYKSHFNLMITGRFVYGLGGESFSVLSNRLLSKEFKGKDLAFSLGLFSSITRLGAILNFSCSPILAEKINNILPCGVGILLTFISIICSMILNDLLKNQKSGNVLMLENKAKNKNRENYLNFEDVCYNMDNDGEIIKSSQIDINNKPVSNTDYYSNIFYEVDFNESPFTPWESVKQDYSSEISRQLSNFDPKQCTLENDMIFYEPNLKQAKSFHSTFILLAIISFCIALIWAPFYSLAPILFKTRYDINSVESGRLLSIIEVLGLFLTPFVGTLADRFGQKIFFILGGCALLITAHLGFAFRTRSPYTLVGVLGVAGPFVNCYWPCIPNLVSENNLTNGFAVIFCVLNFAFTISPILLGSLVSDTNDFEYVEIFIVGVSIIASILTGILIYLNNKFKLGLNSKAEDIY